MRKLPLIAALRALWALPAFADRCDDDYLHVDNWRYYRGGVCRDVTIRELCGDEVVVRHVGCCD
jgi:hypothetical protein